MKARGWLTQDTVPTRHTIAIELPNDLNWSAQFLGAFLLLAQEENWEQFGGLTPSEMAEEWLDIFLKFTGGNTTMIPVGTILEFAGSMLPDGFLWAHGQNVSRETYSDLFDAIGTTFGSGNGSTTFGLPDKRQRAGFGLDTGHSAFDALGEVGGVYEVTLQLSQVPNHNHIQDVHTHGAGYAAGEGFLAGGGGSQGGSVYAGSGTTTPFAKNVKSVTATNQSSGGGGSHPNMPPYIVLNYIIKY